MHKPDATALNNLYKNSRAFVDYHAVTPLRNVLSAVTKVQPNKVFVMTFQQTLTCNPRYIVDELLRRHDDLTVVVVGDGKTLPAYANEERIHWVKRRSYEHFYEQATSRVWIDNANDCSWFPMEKKSSQLSLQTWHGSLGLKKIDAQNQTPRWLRNMEYSVPRTDYLLSNSDFEDWVFRTTYWPQTPILRTGHARNDLFFNDEALEQARQRALHTLGIPADSHVALYAPTFRDHSDAQVGDSDFQIIRDALEARFGGTWTIIVRVHFRVFVETHGVASESPFVVDGSAYPDIQELMAASDVGITDYSSWICDFALSRRPAFLLTPDLDEYENNDRGFYYPLESTPFALARTGSELAERIKAFDQESYDAALDSYFAVLGCTEDGHGAKRAADLIDEVLGSDGPIDLDDNPVVTQLLSQY